MYQNSCQHLREKLENIKVLKMAFDKQLDSVDSFEQIEKLKIARNELNLEIRELEKMFLSENKLVKEFQKQYLDQIKLGAKLRLFQEAKRVITGIDGQKYLAPTWEEILDALTLAHLKQIQELKLENASLLVVPFAYPLQAMITVSSGVVRGDYSEGDGYFSKNSAEDIDKFLYCSHNLMKPGIPTSKTQILKDSGLGKFPGWLVSIVGNHQVKIIDGDNQSFFEDFESGSIEGITLEEAIFLLRRENVVKVNYDLYDTKDGDQQPGDVLVFGNMSKLNKKSYTLRLISPKPEPRSFNCPIAIRIF